MTLVTGGGHTPDKPGVSPSTPADRAHSSGFLNFRVADIAAAYRDWSAKGAEFLTEPIDHGGEIRAYLRDPDGHLNEVGQVTGLPGLSGLAVGDRGAEGALELGPVEADDGAGGGLDDDPMRRVQEPAHGPRADVFGAAGGS